MDRQNVYKIIDAEREYQNILWDGHAQDAFNNVGDFIVYMDDYLRKAKEMYTTKAGKEAGLDMLRKVVALGVACFEVHGVPARGEIK